MTLATIFTLFLVTYGADVKHSTYDSLKACQEAKSLAVIGITIEAKKAQDDATAEAERDRQAKFDAEHPFHEPKTDDERKWVKQGFALSGDTEGMCGLQQRGDVLVVQPWCRAEVRDGKIRYSVESGLATFSAEIPIDNNSIKTAECVIVPEDKP